MEACNTFNFYNQFVDQNPEIREQLKNSRVYMRLLREIETVVMRVKSIDDKLSGKDKFDVDENELKRILNKFFKYVSKIEKDSNPEIIDKLKVFFRNKMKKYLFKSPFTKRGFLKPKGYPGDFFALEAMYNNETSANGIGKLFDRYYLDNDYVEAVRHRKNYLKKYLKDLIVKSPKDKIKILNLACGACREIREMFEEGFTTKKNLEFVFVDQDIQTLRFAEKKLKPFSKKYKFHYVQGHVLFALKENRFENSFGKFDFVYSIGLADYLVDNVLGKMFVHGLQHLDNKGNFLIAHKNTRRYLAPAPDWICDWKFIPRDEKDIRSLTNKFLKKDSYSISFLYGKNKLVFYFSLKKNS